MKKLLPIVFVILLQACTHESRPPLPLGAVVTTSEVTAPDFARVYRVRLNDEFTLIATCSDLWPGQRWYRGEIDQRDEKWATFDLKDPPDKVFDQQAIAPSIKQYAAQIVETDKEYIASKPTEFTDKNGVTWRRVP